MKAIFRNFMFGFLLDYCFFFFGDRFKILSIAVISDDS